MTQTSLPAVRRGPTRARALMTDRAGIPGILVRLSRDADGLPNDLTEAVAILKAGPGRAGPRPPSPTSGGFPTRRRIVTVLLSSALALSFGAATAQARRGQPFPDGHRAAEPELRELAAGTAGLQQRRLRKRGSALCEPWFPGRHLVGQRQVVAQYDVACYHVSQSHP